MEFLKQLLALTWLVSLIAFIVYWRKKAGARKSAGENYKDDENYKNVSRTKRIIGVVCIASFVMIGAINNNSDSGTSSYSSSSNYSSSSSSSSSTSSKQVQETPKNYAEADIDILLSDAKNNAAKANRDYKGKYVKIVGGYVFNVESNARYIQIEGNDPFTLIHVTCKPKDNKVKDAMINLSKGQQVTVYGKITDVGEIMGYSLDLDKVE